MNLTVKGFRIYYEDGTAATFTLPGNPRTAWQNAAALRVLVVTIYFNETYPCWIPELGATRQENYRMIFCSDRGGRVRIGNPATVERSTVPSVDVYWFDPATQEFGAGGLADVPVDAIVKEGILALDDTWRQVYNRAYADLQF